MINDCLTRCVFECFLKAGKECAALTSRGKPFQTRGCSDAEDTITDCFQSAAPKFQTTSFGLDADRRRFRNKSLYL